MRCPKCGFDSEDSQGRELEACPKCGVVFRKLGVDRPPRPSAGPPPVPPPVSRGGGASVFNVVILSFCLSVTGYMAWKRYGEGSRPKPIEASTPGSESAGSAQSGQGTTREVEVEVPVQRPETLMLPGFDKPAPGQPALEPPKAKPRLPPLDESVVTLPLLERAKALALEYPGETYYREYVVGAHLILAVRELRARKYRDALRWVEQSEDWGAPGGEVASFKAAIYDKQESWDLAVKWARTALAYGAKANPAEMHHIIGKVHYFREELKEAIAEFRKALAIREDPTIRASLDKALRDARAADGFGKKRLSHFIVRYEGESMEDTGRMVLDQMERSYGCTSGL